MPLVGSGKPHPRAIVFDLDRALIDPRPAWRYAVEEAVVSVTGRPVQAAALSRPSGAAWSGAPARRAEERHPLQ